MPTIWILRGLAFSANDIETLHRIRDLLADGLNLAGIAYVLTLQDKVAGLEAGSPATPHWRVGRGRADRAPDADHQVSPTGDL